MAAQIGIEVSSTACRIVELEKPRRGAAASLLPTGVRRAEVFPSASPEFAAALSALRGRQASVVVWGAPGDHRQVMVTTGRYDAMRAEAIRSLGIAGVETRGALVDIARVPESRLAPRSGAKVKRQPVVVALANGPAVGGALRPILAAGIQVRTVATPAMALMSLSRLRRAHDAATADHADQPTAPANEIEAFIALEEGETCIAIVRAGSLVAARELMWGFREGRRSELRRDDEIIGLLADELIEFLTTIGGSVQLLGRVTICGGFPALRSIAALLTQRIDVEVDPLDTLFGIDREQLSETVETFAGRVADLRMAWAIAADSPAPLSLLHTRQRQVIQARCARIAVAAGIVAGVGLGWEMAGSSLLRSSSLSSPTVSQRTVSSIPIPKPPPPPDVNFEDDANQ